MEPDHDPGPLHDELVLHFAECAACRDDAADPLGRLLAHVSQDFVAPPLNFTQWVITRLPQASPQQLAQHTQQRRRWFTALSLVPVAVLLLALTFGPVFQGLVAGSALGLLAAALRQVAAAARWTLVVMTASVAASLGLFASVLHVPSTRRALGAIAAAVALLAASAGVGVAVDRANAQRARTEPSAAATVASAIDVQQPVRGDVSSLWGKVSVGQPVQGNVASIFGNIRAQAPVNGHVLVGGGQFTGNPALARAGVVTDLNKLVLASSVPGLSQMAWSPQSIRVVAGSVGAVLVLVLLGLSALLWPNPLARASTTLATQPGVSIGLGMLLLSASVLLLGPLVALLAWSVVGLLSLPLLLVFVHLPVLFGLAVVGGTLAVRIFGRATIWQTLLTNGVLLLGLLGLALLLPLVGLVALYLVASVGFGAMVLSTRQAAAFT